MNVVQQIISKQLLSAMYHNRTIAHLVPKDKLPEFKSELENNPNFDGRNTVRFDNGGYLKLGALVLTGEGSEHTNTVVLVNPEDGSQKAVAESKMIASEFKGIQPTWEVVRY